MATKTVVCQECGSVSAPGRYACSECGALLVAVASMGRGRGSEALTQDGNAAAYAARPDGDARSEPAAEAEPGRAAGSVAATAVAKPPMTDLADPARRGRLNRGRSAGDRSAANAVAVAADPPVAHDPPVAAAVTVAADPLAIVDPLEAIVRHDALDEHGQVGPAPFDEDAPLAATLAVATHPDVLHDIVAAPPATDERADEATAGAVSTGPAWPPAGDRGPLAAPEPRTPAGAYLPPSAVLPPLGAPGGVAGSTAAGTVAVAPASPSPGEPWATRGAAALTGALDSIRVPADASRRVVAIGSGLAAFSFLLPWVNTIPGSSPFANYLDRWGLVGPGVWLVFLFALVLGAIAASSGRTASWPVGLPAVVLAGFLAGLVWPWVVGGASRALGILVVIFGALLLLAGGLLDRRLRHDDRDALV